jgi:hypothetical protein
MLTIPKTWQTLTFSKHKNKTLPQVALTDPGWLLWAMRERAFSNQKLIDEAVELKAKLSSIRLPDHSGEPGRLIISEDWRNFIERIEHVPLSRCVFANRSGTRIVDTLDIVDLIYRAGRNKSLADRLLSQAKNIIFESKRCAMTAKVCADFFDNDNNFKLDSI